MEFDPRRFRSLRWKLLIPLALLGLVTASAGTWHSYHFFSSKIRQQAQRRAEVIAHTVNYAAYSVDDWNELQRFVAAIGAEPDVNLVIVYGGQPSRIVASTDRALLNATPDRLPQPDLAVDSSTRRGRTRFDPDRDEFQLTTPLLLVDSTDHNAPLYHGVVKVHLNTAPIRDQAVSAARLILGLTLGTILLTAVAFYVLLSRLVVEPAAAIARAVNQRGDGGVHSSAPVYAHDEIGQLASTLNSTIEALSDSEQRLQLTLDAVSNGGWDWDVTTGEVLYSDRWISSLGYARRDVEPHIRFWEKLVHPQDRSRVQAALQAHVKGSTEYFQCEYRLRRQSGEYCWNWVRGKVVTRDVSGGATRMVNADTDITKRHQDERDRHEKTVRLELLNRLARAMNAATPIDRLIRDTVEHVHRYFPHYRVCYGTINEAGSFVIAESRQPESMSSFVGLEADLTVSPRYLTALRDRQIVCVKDVEDDERLAPLAKLLLEGGSQAILDVPLEHDEKLVGMICFDAPRMHTWTDHEIGTLSDVADFLSFIFKEAHTQEQRRQAEQSLRDSEVLFRSITEQMADSLFVLDPDDRCVPMKIVQANQSAARKLGYSMEELLGMSVMDLDDEPTAQKVPDRAKKLLDGQVLVFEGGHRRKDGTVMPVEVTTQMIWIDQRRLILGLSRDLTERNRTEGVLRAIVEGTSSATGEAFFESLTMNLADALGTKYAIVGQLIDDQEFKIRSLAMWPDQHKGPIEYHLAGTPCENVIRRQEPSFHPHHVQQQFPDDAMLPKLRIESYLGIPLVDTSGRVIGLLAVMDDVPMVERAEDLSILTIFAARAAAELERIQAEQALRSSERQLRTIFDWAPHGIVLTTHDSQGLLRANKAFISLFGYPQDQLTQMSVSRLTHPDDAERSTAFMQRLYEGEKEFDVIEKRYLREDGSVMWGRLSSAVVRDDVGRFQYFVSQLEDITDRKHWEEELHETNRFLDSLIETIPHMIFVKDAQDLRFVRFNRAGEELVGYPRHELIGKNDFDLFPEDEARFFTEMDRKVLSGTTLVEIPEEPIHTPHHGTRLLRTLKRPILDDQGCPKYLLGISEDITDRKQTEHNLADLVIREKAARAQAEQSSSQITNIIERISDGFVALDSDWRYTYVNQKAGQVLDRTPQSLIGKHIWTEFPEGVEQPFYHAYQKAVADQKPVYFEEYYSPWGRWFENRVYPSKDGLSIFFRDVTDRKRAQQQLAEMNRELNLKNRELEQFLFAASHDLQSPLVTIIGYTGHIQNKLRKGESDELDDMFGRVHRAARRMKRGITDLLDFSRIGRVKFDPRPVDAAAMFQEIHEALADRFAQLNVEFEVQPDMPTVTADRDRLWQMFENLLINALKYGCGNPQPKIWVGGAIEDRQARIFVRDNGEGIEEAYHDKIFGLFQRLDTRREGTGVGLAIVERIAEIHNGRAWVESQPGQGATFWVAFPNEPPP